MPSPKTFWQTRFSRLRYAFAWLAFAVMRAVVRLPLTWQLRFGRLAGRISLRTAAALMNETMRPG